MSRRNPTDRDVKDKVGTVLLMLKDVQHMLRTAQTGNTSVTDYDAGVTESVRRAIRTLEPVMRVRAAKTQKEPQEKMLPPKEVQTSEDRKLWDSAVRQAGSRAVRDPQGYITSVYRKLKEAAQRVEERR